MKFLEDDLGVNQTAPSIFARRQKIYFLDAFWVTQT